MPTDKNKVDEYPKLSENDKRWKQQDEYDSSGAQRQSEDDDKNASISDARKSSTNDDAENKDSYSSNSEKQPSGDR